MARVIRYMLDTNTVSYLVRRQSAVVRRVGSMPVTSLCISAITAGELIYGLMKVPDARRLHKALTEFMRRIDVLPWETRTAARYGSVKAEMQRQGNALGPLDLLIASHALAVEAVLVTSDKAFNRVRGLQVEDWTIGLDRSGSRPS
jgi:tRNA(fMet)-specific endonuclease VapC